jgi:hypothetical protein
MGTDTKQKFKPLMSLERWLVLGLVFLGVILLSILQAYYIKAWTP